MDYVIKPKHIWHGGHLARRAFGMEGIWPGGQMIWRAFGFGGLLDRGLFLEGFWKRAFSWRATAPESFFKVTNSNMMCVF